MSPSPRPDPNAWRRNQPSSSPAPPTGASRRKKVVIGISAAAAGILGFGLLGGLIEATGGDSDPGGSSTAPSDPGGDGDGPNDTAQEPQGGKQESVPNQPDDRRRDGPARQEEDSGPDQSRVTVQRIVDGDTFVVSGNGSIVPDRDGIRVRLLEVDTPEAGQCFADKATARTSALLPVGSTIRIERDDDLKDRYGRYLLYAWNDNGKFVNLSLVSGGFAKAVLYPPNDKYWQRISGAEGGAETARAGLWAGCDKAPPPREKSESPGPVKPATPDPPDPDPPKPDPPKPEPARPEKPTAPAGPPAGGPDLDCSDFPGSVPVGPDDPHRLDRDGDGIGCD